MNETHGDYFQLQEGLYQDGLIYYNVTIYLLKKKNLKNRKQSNKRRTNQLNLCLLRPGIKTSGVLTIFFVSLDVKYYL